MSKTTRTLDQRNPPRLVNERMEHSGHSALNESKILLEPHGETQLDFFHKLGYSTEQVQDVLHKFGLNTDTKRLTDRVLGELVRAGASPEDKEVTIMSVLVSRSLQEEQSMSLSREDGDALRPIVIDGSNVAMSHGNKEVFSCLGIQLAVSYFLERGHTDVTVFVPSWRKEQPRPDVPITDQHILRDLERKKCLVFTPSRRVAGKRVVCYDDRFIVKLAYGSDGIIVSNDTFRDLQGENPDWKRFIEERLLMYSFVNDKFMPPDDPLGRHGPTLDNFLRKVPRTPKKQLCPYGKKCTYGIKCKFHHPDRANHSHCCLADELREKARQSSSAHKHCLLGSRPVTANGLSLEEAMAQKLTLEQWRGSLKKGHTSENVVLIQGGRRSSRRPPSRKEKASKHSPSDLDSLFSSGSQEQLDSGLGSIDNAPVETFWYPADHGYGASYRSFHPNSSPRPLQCEATVPLNVHNIGSPKSTPCPCSCCSHVPSSSWATAGFHPHSQHQNRGLAGTHHPDMIAYTPAHYYGYGASVYPVSMHAYSHPAEFQHSRAQDSLHRAYWSDPFQGYAQAVSRMSGEKPLFEPSHMTQPGPCGKEREDVRKKLLAIFNACLVDKAMDMFPQLMDPQMLAAEILMLQSQGRPLK